MSGTGQSKKQLFFRILFTLCLAGTIVFIFYNSSEIGALSGLRSAAVTERLNGLLGRAGVSLRLTEHRVRKLAHFGEYALLGFWLMLTLRVYTCRLLAHISWPLFFGLLIPVVDEGYQLLVPGRAGQLQDVILDFAGVLAGTCFGLFVLLLFRAFWQELQGEM